MSNTRALHHRIWRTAFERGKFELKYPTHAECVKMRLNLYRSVKEFREEDKSPDKGFTRMIEKMEMVIEPYTPGGTEPGGFLLIMRNKDLNPLNIEAARALDALSENPNVQ